MFVTRPIDLTFVSATLAQADAPAWDAATLYGTGDRVSRLGFEYVSVLENNVNIPPEDEMQALDGARWVLDGPVNSRAFLDGSPSRQTLGSDGLTLEVTAGARFDTIALFKVFCGRCTVEVFDSAGALKGTKTFAVGIEPITTWWGWANTVFNEFDLRQIVKLDGVAGDTIRVTLFGPDPALGELFCGRAIQIGTTRLSAKTKAVGRTFTDITTNAFGTTDIRKRAIVRDVTYHVWTKRTGFAAIRRFLDEVEGIRVVSFAPAVARSELINVGFLEQVNLPIEVPDDFQFELTVKGVV